MSQNSSINLMTHQVFQSSGISSDYYPEITSTNDVAKKEFPNKNQDFAIYLADHQTQGRGRNQNTWQNLSGGEVLLSTWCFKLSQSPQPIITPLLGLSLYQNLLKISPDLPLRLQAPNDIYLGEGKLSGLLVEVSQVGSDSYVYVGLGLNVFDSPSVDLNTSCLAKHTTIDSNNWSAFCKSLKAGFSEALQKGIKPELEAQDQKDLLSALNASLDTPKYLEVSPMCDLVTKDDTISWMTL